METNSDINDTNEFRAVDLDGDGTEDAIILQEDVTGDGIEDNVLIYQENIDDTGEIDTVIAIDDGGDGTFEAAGVDLGSDETLDVVLVDTNGDGTFDQSIDPSEFA
ncbi:MAG: hypothetical protein VKN72_20100 [Nostocales cyanobacterium 94392]|nr:hypothetical protein [Nostocales cyanobacterium 94392]